MLRPLSVPRTTARVLLVVFSAVPAALAASGCETAPRNPNPEARPSHLRPSVRDDGSTSIVGVRQIVDEGGKPVGYLKVMEEPAAKGLRRPVRVAWVYDKNFQRQGFYTDTGDTYR